jgi:predicted ATP-grasp superfamily ATP-dependent carboligase
VNILLTSVRMPFGIDEVRKLGRSGHRILASETHRTAPGVHSRYVTKRFVTPTPRYETRDFIHFIGDVVHTHAIDLVVPIFEEALYLARQHRVWDETDRRLFAPSFDTLVRLHDKSQFPTLARSLAIPSPPTCLVRSPSELRERALQLGSYVARPAFSRGGFEVVTNRGPLQQLVSLEQAEPTAARPWIVQPYLDGRELCTFSIAQHGKVVAHLTYVHPRTLQHAGGITFESVVVPETLEYTRRLVEATEYHGQLGLDLIETAEGLQVLECNARATAGVALMDDDVFDRAVRDRIDDPPYVAPSGLRAKISLGLLRDMFLNLRELPADVDALFSRARDVYVSHGDPMPVLYALLAYGQVRRWKAYTGASPGTRRRLLHSMFFDICWNDGAA